MLTRILFGLYWVLSSFFDDCIQSSGCLIEVVFFNTAIIDFLLFIVILQYSNGNKLRMVNTWVCCHHFISGFKREFESWIWIVNLNREFISDIVIAQMWLQMWLHMWSSRSIDAAMDDASSDDYGVPLWA